MRACGRIVRIEWASMHVDAFGEEIDKFPFSHAGQVSE